MSQQDRREQGSIVQPEMDFDRSVFSILPFAERVDKPWGYELVFTLLGKRYAGKRLHVNPGRRLILQIHDHK